MADILIIVACITFASFMLLAYFAFKQIHQQKKALKLEAIRKRVLQTSTRVIELKLSEAIVAMEHCKHSNIKIKSQAIEWQTQMVRHYEQVDLEAEKSNYYEFIPN